MEYYTYQDGRLDASSNSDIGAYKELLTRKEHTMEWINSDTYADRKNHLYKFIGIVNGMAYFLNDKHETELRHLDGTVCGDGKQKITQDIIRHVKPKVKRKGYAYMFGETQYIGGMTCMGVICPDKMQAINVGDKFTNTKPDSKNPDSCILIELEYFDGEGFSVMYGE